MKNASILGSLVILLLLFACNPANQANLQAAKDQIIKTNDELFHKGNLDIADDVFAPDYRDQGPKFIKEAVRQLRTAFPDLQVKVEPIIAEGNMTGWRRIHTGTHREDIWGFPPTGKEVSWESIIISRKEGDKVVEEWGQSNFVEIMQEASRPKQDAQEVIATLQRATKALNDNDAATYLSVLHPDNSRFLPTSANLSEGINDKQAMEKDFQNGLDFDIQMEDLQVAFYDKTAILTGYQTGTNRFPDGQVITGRRKYSAVFIWQGSQWKNVHFHISRAQ